MKETSKRQLEIFIAVYEENSMTKAGKRLYMSQPAISQVIREIEEFYGTAMFTRIGTKLYVTQAGEKFYDYAKRILHLFEDMDKELSAQDEATSRIRIGCNISAGTVLVRDYIKEFNKRYPSIKVFVKTSRSTVLENELFHNQLDFAIMEDLMRDAKGLIQEPYHKDRIVIVASPNHPLCQKDEISIWDLKDENWLLRESGAGVRDKIDSILKLNDIYIEPLWESSTTKALVNAVMDGFGISVLPYLLIKKYLESRALKELVIKDIALDRNLNIVYHKDKLFTKPMREFIEIMKEFNSK
ncbi:putative transcriptional regulator [Lachnospiraceae bacterium TWA4]|nr:putative transcriptional regulator [Lachnospiraceae bacterium TWA4]